MLDRRTLWVCLICGHAGCGGGDATEPGHARDHYRATLHAYALDVASQHVWDFAGEGYVHRLALQRGEGHDEVLALGSQRDGAGPALRRRLGQVVEGSHCASVLDGSIC